MLKTIFIQELKYWCRSISFYIYLSAILFLSILTMAAASGVFGEDSVSQGVISNSPMNIFSLMNFFNKILLFLLPAVTGLSVYRDFKSNAHSLLYSYPMTKTDYLAGKFLSSFLIVSLIALTVIFGFMIGSHFPGIIESLTVPLDPVVYFKIYSIYLIPNLLLFSSVIFAVVVFSRNTYAGFITVIVLLIVRESVMKLTGGAESGAAYLLADPFCESAVYYYTANISVTELNLMDIPFEPLILYNRLIWLAVTAFILFIVFRNFSFSQTACSFKFKKTDPERVIKNNFGGITKLKLPVVNYCFGFVHQLKVAWKLSCVNFKFIISGGSFISILIAGSLLVLIILLQMNPQYDNRILPLTWVMLGFPVFFFSSVINLMTFLYAGVLIHRDRTSRINELTDISPVSDWVLLFSKFLALLKMQILILSGLMAAGICVQIYSGFYKFEIGHYIFDLFVIHLPGFIIWALAALFIQSLVSNQYLSLLLLIGGSFLISQFPRLGIEKLIFRFNQNPEPDFFLKYSDLSGYSHSLLPYFTYKTYWLLCGVFLFAATLLVWQRGLSQSFNERISSLNSRLRNNTGLAVSLIVSLILFLSMGFWINKIDTSADRILAEEEKEKISLEADRKYEKFRLTVQPRIVSVKVNMNIYPESHSFRTDGIFTIKNRSDHSIDTLLVNYAFNVNTKYSLDKESKFISRDTVAHFDIILLNDKLAPGDSLKLSFEVENMPNTVLHKNSPVEKNGTFITSEIYPGLGYYSGDSYTDVTDSSYLKNHYRSIDSDFIDFEATVSTSADQTAIAPGYLKEEWIDKGRRYFRYNSAEKVTNDYVFLSGKYEIKKDKWNDIVLEIFYHKGHEYNLDHLMRGMKAALEYNEKYFGPYQHKQARIIEYSRSIGNFAMSFANTIPYSESNFVMDIDDSNENGLNTPVLGAAHELSHQWWGLQVIPANVIGVRMITESMAEYVSLKVLEHMYGKNRSVIFLKKALDIYLGKRNSETDIEKPLMYNDGLSKSFIPYQKGSIVMNAMSEYLGEEIFNGALNKYFMKERLQEAPYSTSSEMLSFIREFTPDSLMYLIKDMFETVTFYDNRILNVAASKLYDGKYKTGIEFEISKYRISESGVKIYENSLGQAIKYSDRESGRQITSLPLKDYIEICIFTEQKISGKQTEELIFNNKYRICQIHNTISIITDDKPSKVSIDPFITLIDTDIRDNVYIVK